MALPYTLPYRLFDSFEDVIGTWRDADRDFSMVGEERFVCESTGRTRTVVRGPVSV